MDEKQDVSGSMNDSSRLCDTCTHMRHCYGCLHSRSCHFTELGSNCFHCHHCESCHAVYDCRFCFECKYSADLRMCEHMLFCYKMAGKQYCVFNVPVDKNEYERIAKLLPKKVFFTNHASIKDCWAKWWNKASESDRQAIQDLPHFDPLLFLEITGIDLREQKSA